MKSFRTYRFYTTSVRYESRLTTRAGAWWKKAPLPWFVYEGTNRVVSLPNGLQLECGSVYDSCRPNLVVAKTVSTNGLPAFTQGFGYDAMDRLTFSSNTLSTANSYGYNGRSEVSGVDIGENRYLYHYDSIGNRTYSSGPSGAIGYVANCLNQYETISWRFPTYDADGNLTNDYTVAYEYDAENRMVSAAPNPGNGSWRIRNVYDYRHRRIGKMVDSNASGSWATVEAHTFVYDGWLPVLETIVDSNNATNFVEYFWGPDLSGTEQGAGGIGGLIATSVNGQLYFPTYDHNGNITAYYDSSGSQVAWYVYDAFGNTITEGGDMAEAFHFRFSTKYWDEETGMYYYGYRFYVPWIGRWLNRDPIGEEGGLNLLAFFQNNLLCNLDGQGLHWVGGLPIAIPQGAKAANYATINYRFSAEEMAASHTEFLNKHFDELREKLERELAALCPDKDTRGIDQFSNMCCKPEKCLEEAAKLASGYIVALQEAYEKRPWYFPGGMVGNVMINFVYPRECVGESYPEDSGDLEQGLVCGGWANMGTIRLSGILKDSECWRYEERWRDPSILEFRFSGHAWGELIQTTSNATVVLDPWQSGGWRYREF